ncbi:MAG TPA: exodeoxyribonuclease VII large subunit [Blastocatellia bacterium]|nr:exodeoxyribonuclease VII large subunit [Blastocatellia bacterium]
MSQLTFLEQLMQNQRALSVSELTGRLKTLVENSFFEVHVEGEISNLRRHTSGHWYFTLKDEVAALRCACFRMQNRLIRFAPEDGLTVSARGRLSIYEARGEYQLVVEYLEPVGVGALQLAFEQLKSKLAAEGLFDPERKRPLPLLPRWIGIVTSPTGAAVRDIVRVIRRRNEAVSVLIAPARVQGEGAAFEIAQAIRVLSAREEVDVIIVGRGGGSQEDLWCFNDERVARAIVKSRVPVISAVGHETDFTIADFVADLRASTPSAAAEMVAAAHGEISARVEGLRSDLSRALRYRVIELRSRIAELESNRAFDSVQMKIRGTSQRLDDAAHSMETTLRDAVKTRRAGLGALALRLSDADLRRGMIGKRLSLDAMIGRLTSTARSTLDHSRERLSIGAGKLTSLSPLAVLARGYAIVFDEGGRVVKRAADVNSGDRVSVRLSEGTFAAVKE